jgi:putative chitobiose transport system substrate-binding protein
MVAPAPVGEAGWKELDVMALAVTSTSRNRSAAAALAAFITSAGPQVAFSKLVPVFPSVRSAYDDPFFTASDASLTSDARQIGAQQIPAARVLRPSVPHYPRLREIFKEHMLTCFLGRRSPADALALAQAQWNEVLAEP